MDNHSLFEIKATLVIEKPAHEVFEAIVDPDKMVNYFLSAGSGRMEEGQHIVWNFAEVKEDVPILVGKIEKDRYISYHWDGLDGTRQLVEITLTPKGPQATVVRVTEKGHANNEAGIKWLKSNTEGWANFLACLKAYLEYGINLRKGAFDF